MLSIIIPTFNEAETIGSCLEELQGYRRQGHEIIICDGGSTDNTPRLIQGKCDRFISVTRGRARQMNAGAAIAHGDMLVFLHADTRLPPAADRLIDLALQTGDWGFFRIRLDGRQVLFRTIETLMNWRSRLGHIATGDQTLFIRRDLFNTVDGYQDIDIMEDIAFCKTLKTAGLRPSIIASPVTTSSRRWEKGGIMRTILLMWRIRLAYSLGTDPSRLSRYYR